MDKYRKKIEKALQAGETAAVRRELLDIARNHADAAAACVAEDGADVCAETESPAESVSEFIDAAAPDMHLSEKIPADDQWSHPERRKLSGVKIAGYVMMLLSLAAIIVALCIPITWLLGVGIAVFMIAAAVVYLNLRA